MKNVEEEKLNKEYTTKMETFRPALSVKRKQIEIAQKIDQAKRRRMETLQQLKNNRTNPIQYEYDSNHIKDDDKKQNRIAQKIEEAKRRKTAALLQLMKTTNKHTQLSEIIIEPEKNEAIRDGDFHNNSTPKEKQIATSKKIEQQFTQLSEIIIEPLKNETIRDGDFNINSTPKEKQIAISKKIEQAKQRKQEALQQFTHLSEIIIEPEKNEAIRDGDLHNNSTPKENQIATSKKIEQQFTQLSEIIIEPLKNETIRDGDFNINSTQKEKQIAISKKIEQAKQRKQEALQQLKNAKETDRNLEQQKHRLEMEIAKRAKEAKRRQDEYKEMRRIKEIPRCCIDFLFYNRSSFSIASPPLNSVWVFQKYGRARYNSQQQLWIISFDNYFPLLEALKKKAPQISVSVFSPEFEKIIISTPHSQKRSPLDISLQNLPLLKDSIDSPLYAKLLPFQREGVCFAIHNKGRCLIADEMGLGKTLQAVAIALFYKPIWPLLVICPSSLRFHWAETIHEWCSELRYNESLKIHLDGKHLSFASHLVNIVSYDLMPKYQYRLAAGESPPGFIICDESHFLKSYKSRRTKAILPLLKAARHCLLLSGTPALSRPAELFTQISAIAPPIVYQFFHFWP